jgi:uncharacterized membrane protein
MHPRDGQSSSSERFYSNPAVLVALATATAAALRLPFLDKQSFWLDETYTVGIIAKGSLVSVWHAVEATESTPPLYYLLTWGWTHLIDSQSEPAIRSMSAIAGIASVPVAFLAFRKLFGESLALAVAWMTAVSPLLVWYSLDARSYGLLVLVSLLSLWAFACLFERPTRMRWVGWTLAAIASAWTHYFAIFMIAAELAVLVWRRPALKRQLLACTAAVAVGAIPSALVFAAQNGGAGRTDWISSRPLQDRVEQLAREFPAGPNVPWAWLEGLALVLVGGALIAALLLWRSRRRRSGPLAVADASVPDGATALLTIGLIAIGLPLLLAVTHVNDHFFARNVLIAWPTMAGLTALALVRLKAIPLFAYLAVCVVTVVAVQGDWRYGKADWRGAMARLDSGEGGAPLIIYPALQAPTANYYLPLAPVAAPIRTRDVWTVVEPARQGSRALTPLPGAPPPVALDPRLRSTEAISYHGFLLERFASTRPVVIEPARVEALRVRGFAPIVVLPSK